MSQRTLTIIWNGILGMLGIGGGVVYRSGTVVGGTYALALILRRRFGTPMSTTYFYTDTGVIIVAAFVFGIEGALYAAVVLFLNGVAQDYVMEGPSVVRTAMIVTNKPGPIAQRIMTELQVAVTRTTGEGRYTNEQRDILHVTVSRAKAPIA
ncbi:MAG: YitT family protein [Anaerolineales bacterium]